MLESEIEIESVDTHTAGEPTRIVTAGIDESMVGKGSVREKRDKFASEHDWIREMLMKEPRGHSDMFGAVLVEPQHEDADLGVFFMDSGSYEDMCGHATIGIVTALIEDGDLNPKPSLQIEAPCGQIHAHPRMNDASVERVTVENVPSFVLDSISTTIDTDTDQIPIQANIVYSGNLFALVDAENFDLPINTSTASLFQKYGKQLQRRINSQNSYTHPFTEEQHDVSIIEFYESGKPDRNIVIFGDRAQIDRSPCGSGTCAKVTYLFAKGSLEKNENYPYESVIGTHFDATVEKSEMRNNITVVYPKVAGSAYITGKHTFLRDPDDPLVGFSVHRNEEPVQETSAEKSDSADSEFT